jgi:biopolymer transport protein TolQ
MGGGVDREILGLVGQAGPVVKAVLFLILFLSIFSWAIIIQKALAFRKARRSLREAEILVQQLDGLEDAPVAHSRLQGSPWGRILASAYAEAFGKNLPGETFSSSGGVGSHDDVVDRLRRAMDRTATMERDRYEEGVLSLGTVANIAPFIGLFGTVWGIMNSFLAIGLSGAASLVAVGPGIAEALIATAAALAAAIPAAVGYNHFLGRLRAMESDLERVSGIILDRARYAEKKTIEAKQVSYSL